MHSESLAWLERGRGPTPRLRWSWATDAPLVAFDLARESGHIWAADTSGGLYCLDRRGRIGAMTRGLKGIRALAVSDTGDAGMVLVGPSTICRFTTDLTPAWTAKFPDAVTALAIDPRGEYTAVSLADRGSLILDSDNDEVSVFETLHALVHLRFVTTVAELIGAAQHDLLCRYALNGGLVWSEKLWANAGDMSISGNGRKIFLAAHNMGIQTFNSRGQHRESFVVDGTAKCIDASFTGDRLVVATVEGHLYWLDADGTLIWATRVDDELTQVACDPLGEWIVCGFANGRLMRLDW